MPKLCELIKSYKQFYRLNLDYKLFFGSDVIKTSREKVNVHYSSLNYLGISETCFSMYKQYLT